MTRGFAKSFNSQAVTRAWSQGLAAAAAAPSFFTPDLLAEPLFKERDAGFCYSHSDWTMAVQNGDRERYRSDALAHRKEAIRRMVVCRLEDRADEAHYWHNEARWLEKTMHLPEIKPDGE